MNIKHAFNREANVLGRKNQDGDVLLQLGRSLFIHFERVICLIFGLIKKKLPTTYIIPCLVFGYAPVLDAIQHR